MSLLAAVLVSYWTIRLRLGSSLVGPKPGAFPLGGVIGRLLTKKSSFPYPEGVSNPKKGNKKGHKKTWVRIQVHSAL